MIPIEFYWCEETPTLDDVKFAYERVRQGVVVMIKWWVRYSGHYEKIVTPETIKDMDEITYFNEIIPHCYGV